MRVRLSETPVRVLPEAWAGRVSEFIRSAGTIEEAESEGRPETVFSRVYLPAQMGYYSDFNVRSRQFRCLENFFIAAGDDDEIRAVVSLDGLRSNQVVASINLIVAHLSEGDRAEDLRALFEGVLGEVRQYTNTERLRIGFLYDTSFESAVGVRISEQIVDAPESLGMVEEARFPNETGRTREAILLAFSGRAGAEPLLAAGDAR